MKEFPWHIFARYGLPGLALAGFFFLFSKFDFEFSPVGSEHSWIVAIVFLALTAIVVTVAIIRGSNKPEADASNTPELGAEETKLVVFDLDGTLIRGNSFKYSWKYLWHAVGLPEQLRRDYYNAHVEDKSITYQEWCDKCVARLRERGLTEAMIRELASKLTLAGDAKLVLEHLKEKKIRIAIISGGIDTFLEVHIPDWARFFDEVFINELDFDESGVISSCKGTKYDFEKKIDGIERLIQKYKISWRNVMFIGEGKNDYPVFAFMRENGVGITVAAPPNDTGVEHRAEHTLEQDSISGILNLIKA
jgi:HAD superfamily phosphoserine phosphatase-like hydrolase